MAYNDRMKEARRLKGLTQAELGELVGCAKTPFRDMRIV